MAPEQIKLKGTVAKYLEDLRQDIVRAQERYKEAAMVALMGEGIDLRALPAKRISITPDGEVIFADESPALPEPPEPVAKMTVRPA